MMSSPTQPGETTVPTTHGTRNPSRSPLPLSASQESQVRELYYKRVRQKCADEVRGTHISPHSSIHTPTHTQHPLIDRSLTPAPDFAACATARTFTATLFCRKEQKAMNNCMMRFATQEEQDKARAEWFATVEERRVERERREEKRKKDEVFWREWWDKDKKHLSTSKEDGGGQEGKR